MAWRSFSAISLSLLWKNAIRKWKNQQNDRSDIPKNNEKERKKCWKKKIVIFTSCSVLVIFTWMMDEFSREQLIDNENECPEQSQRVKLSGLFVDIFEYSQTFNYF